MTNNSKIKINVNGYDLDKEQMKPIIENPKYSIIIAGAGSGKSLTLIGKIKYLLDNNIYKKEEICCISFTNEATNSLSNSISKNCKENVECYTFHKLALKILKESNITYKIASPNLLNEIIDEFFISKCFGNNHLQNIIFKIFHIYFFKNNKKWNNIINSKELNNLKRTIITFINLMKSNGYGKESFDKFFKNKKHKNLLIIIYSIYTIYETEKESSSLIDFDDMMSVAKKTLLLKKNILPFKLIIIDEFQDTSLCRFNLINEIIKQNDASLCVVGDDYQSIYNFSGCDLNLFLHFKDYYKSAQIYKLEKTYRNSQELIWSAGKFIMKNSSQIKKNLISDKHLEKPIIISYFKDKTKVLEKVIKEIDPDKEILILGRNNFDLKNYLTDYKLLENNYIELKNFKDRRVRYLTIHSSKGLESEIVILLNVEDNIYGIPSKQKDESILSLVKNELPFPYEEERRLFYVALTRTKSYIYLLTPISSPSIFIKEIKKDKNVNIRFV